MGKVKTRLAATIGAERALQVYSLLLKHTHAITANLSCTKYIYYADEVVEGDLWDSGNYVKKIQNGNDLGERMINAFKAAFEARHTQVAIIGSDCYELKTEIILNAFDCLDENDAVIGPARDGGYYLLGLRKLLPSIFKDKNWSTSTVCSDTLEDIESLGLRYMLLPTLNDVDEEVDLERSNILL